MSSYRRWIWRGEYVEAAGIAEPPSHEVQVVFEEERIDEEDSHLNTPACVRLGVWVDGEKIGDASRDVGSFCLNGSCLPDEGYFAYLLATACPPVYLAWDLGFRAGEANPHCRMWAVRWNPEDTRESLEDDPLAERIELDAVWSGQPS